MHFISCVVLLRNQKLFSLAKKQRENYDFTLDAQLILQSNLSANM